MTPHAFKHCLWGLKSVVPLKTISLKKNVVAQVPCERNHYNDQKLMGRVLGISLYLCEHCVQVSEGGIKPGMSTPGQIGLCDNVPASSLLRCSSNTGRDLVLIQMVTAEEFARAGCLFLAIKHLLSLQLDLLRGDARLKLTRATTGCVIGGVLEPLK